MQEGLRINPADDCPCCCLACSGSSARACRAEDLWYQPSKVGSIRVIEGGFIVITHSRGAGIVITQGAPFCDGLSHTQGKAICIRVNPSAASGVSGCGHHLFPARCKTGHRYGAVSTTSGRCVHLWQPCCFSQLRNLEAKVIRVKRYAVGIHFIPQPTKIAFTSKRADIAQDTAQPCTQGRFNDACTLIRLGEHFTQEAARVALKEAQVFTSFNALVYFALLRCQFPFSTSCLLFSHHRLLRKRFPHFFKRGGCAQLTSGSVFNGASGHLPHHEWCKRCGEVKRSSCALLFFSGQALGFFTDKRRNAQGCGLALHKGWHSLNG